MACLCKHPFILVRQKWGCNQPSNCKYLWVVFLKVILVLSLLLIFSAALLMNSWRLSHFSDCLLPLFSNHLLEDVNPLGLHRQMNCSEYETGFRQPRYSGWIWAGLWGLQSLLAPTCCKSCQLNCQCCHFQAQSCEEIQVKILILLK